MMIFTPLRLISWFLGLLVIGVPLAAVILFLLAISGSPGSCAVEDRPITPGLTPLVAFQQKWNQLNSTLDAGQTSTIVLNESEVTAQARFWVNEHDVPVTDVLVCFTADGGAASGKVDIPFFPGDVDVLIRGTVDLRGEHPQIVIDDIEMGNLPTPLTDLMDGRVESIIDDQTEEIILRHDYGASFQDGTMTVNGQP